MRELAQRPTSDIVVPLSLDADGAKRLKDAFLSSRSSKNTRRAYEGSLADFAAYLSRRASRPLTPVDAVAELLKSGPGGANLLVLEYRDQLRARKLSPGSVNRHLACLRSALELANTLGMVPWKLKVPNLRTAGPYKDTRGPGRSMVQRMLLELTRRGGAKAKRDAAVLRLLYDLGLRRFEVAGLDMAHVDIPGTRVSVLRKGKLERIWLSMPAPTIRVLETWLAVRGKGPGPLFVGFRGSKGRRLAGSGVYLLVRDLGRAVGVRTRPHAVRHTSITEACKRAQANGIGLEEVRQFSGHSDVRTLMVYRDQERDVQGKLAAMVAESADGEPRT